MTTTDGPIILTRPEQQALFPMIAELYGDAAPAIDSLRQHPDYNQKLTVMALYDGQLAGHFLLLPIGLPGRSAVLATPPIIAPAYQGHFIGSALIYESFEVCRRAKIDALFIIGHLAQYQKFGFRLASEYGITAPDITAPLLVFELTSGSLSDAGGALDIPSAFEALLP